MKSILPPVSYLAEVLPANHPSGHPILLGVVERLLAPRIVHHASWRPSWCLIQMDGLYPSELLPVNEHPFDGSWGYQPTGLYAPTRRFGTREDFRYFIHAAHAAGLNVILDWVPGHFPPMILPSRRLTGPRCTNTATRAKAITDWNTLIYNYGRREVSNFLVGNALYWIERFGIDALRVDAVASMIYRDYSRKEGEWVPNEFGGRKPGSD